jgi:hypothetical protein
VRPELLKRSPAGPGLAAHPRYARIEKPSDLPPPSPTAVDVAVLDMNHAWPNLGHASLVHELLEQDAEARELEQATGIAIRVLSFDVRKSGMVPEAPGGRFAFYLGTGGPGHLDPHCNDGVSPGSQGLHENPAWEKEAFALFEAILADDDAGFLAICHSFGVLCRWSGVAQPVLRGPEKGKSTGVLENMLSAESAAHPWFGRFGDGPERRLLILDNRLFDLMPVEPFPPHVLAIGYETEGVGGPRGDALTMMEFARERDGVLPRVFGVNHHPEVVDRRAQLAILEERVAAGEVTKEWAHERLEILTRSYPDEDSESRLRETSEATLFGPMRFYQRRELRRRAEELGHGSRLSRLAMTSEPALPRV